MSILLTGATGYIGSSVLRHLIDQGFAVTALVRDETKASQIRAAGATPLVGDARDIELIADASEASDGVIHLASSKDVDHDFITGVFRGLEGSNKPFVHTGGIWTYGDNPDIIETSPADPPTLTSWRGVNESRVHDALGIRAITVAPGIVYGYGKGVPTDIVGAPITETNPPALRLIGDGTQHWATVHVDDLAALYVLAFENGTAGSTYIAASGHNPTVRELSEAAAAAAGIAGGVAAESPDASRERLGAGYADALLLDQQASGTRARIDLGWEPNRPSLVEELTSGSYAPQEPARA
jgi:nucleoside-diphosphate-sugar epimerase